MLLWKGAKRKQTGCRGLTTAIFKLSVAVFFLLFPVVDAHADARIAQRPILHPPVTAGHRTPLELSRPVIITNPTAGAELMRHAKGVKLSANPDRWVAPALHPMTGTQHG